MTTIFDEYSKYYDLFYKDKDYHGECVFIDKLLKLFSPSCKEILNIGCGTGKHDLVLSKMGYQATGIDNSPIMIKIARENNQTNQNLFEIGDALNFNLSKKFDAAISLFHVASYQTTNDQMIKYLSNMKKHIKADGIIIIDYWHLPAVINSRPEFRIKRFESDYMVIDRITTPTTNFTDCTANIHFEIKVNDKNTHVSRSFEENHKMRFFTINEIELFGEIAGLKCIQHGGWPRLNSLPTIDDWYAYSILTCK